MKTIGEKIKELRKQKGYTQEELAKLCGYTSLTTINKIELGKIRVTLETVEKLAKIFDISPSDLMGWSNIPELLPVNTKKIRMLGNVACGKPIYADEEVDCYFEVDNEINADFAVRAKGDSMIGARIFDGDIVFVREQSMVENGDIAVVIVDDSVTLKRVYYYRDKNKLILQAENPKYEPFVYIENELDTVRILGKAIAFQSRL